MNNKTTALIGLGVVVVIVLIVVFSMNKKPNTPPPSANQTQNQTSTVQPSPQPISTPPAPAPAPAAVAPSPKPKAAASPAPAKLSYGDALATYQYKIQLLACHSTPGSLIVKKGSPVMFDNRDHNTHAIVLGNQTVSVPGLDYTVFYPQVLGNFDFTCDDGGSGILMVQP